MSNTDTINVLFAGEEAFADVLLAGGPLASGATPEAVGAPEIEIQVSGPTAASASTAHGARTSFAGVPQKPIPDRTSTPPTMRTSTRHRPRRRRRRQHLGGTGRDRINASPGRDVINVPDTARDTVTCGAVRDRVNTDRGDRVNGCERISRR